MIGVRARLFSFFLLLHLCEGGMRPVRLRVEWGQNTVKCEAGRFRILVFSILHGNSYMDLFVNVGMSVFKRIA